MKQQNIVLTVLLVVLILVACVPKAIDPTGKEMVLAPVWSMEHIRRSGDIDIYEFTDYERGEHCYVLFGYDRAGLSCSKIGEGGQ